MALVPGDCTGIGPEQTARILADGNLADVARLVVIGDARVLEMGMAQAGVRLDVERIASPAQACWRSGAVQLVDLADGIIPAPMIRRVMDACWNLESLPNAAEIAKMSVSA